MDVRGVKETGMASLPLRQRAEKNARSVDSESHSNLPRVVGQSALEARIFQQTLPGNSLGGLTQRFQFIAQPAAWTQGAIKVYLTSSSKQVKESEK